ncbi:DNA primase family protein [Carnobacterium pleistocenium]|uniref:DNA primase family protein n=1 Tax=Carnobacterium pleistocenium TaxID=181073 RepID=UPI00055306B5|nr:DNA primase family protein [Carnobacterium pleistocenium]
MFYKGYIIIKNKKSIEKIKGRDEFKTFEQVQSLPDYAGILANETILIDVDNYEQSEILMDIVENKQLRCRVYETTRGKHFLFKKPDEIEHNRTDATLAVGIKADIKLGSKNSYEVLKHNGIGREIIYDLFDYEESEVAPKWMFPMQKESDFFSLGEGDGRNQTLFNYILTLQSEGFTKEESKETINLINKYIISQPLDESELEVILRDGAFQKELFFKKNQFLFDKFAVFLKNNAHVKRISDQLHIYQDGIYTQNRARIEGEMVKHIPILANAKRKEVMSYLEIINPENEKVSSPEYILFRNGVLNIQTSELTAFSPEYIITNQVPWDYNPNAYDEITDQTLNKMACNDPAIRYLLEELAGYTLYRRNELGKAFILTGEKSNGKSTFIDVLKNMLGEKNTVSLDLNELGERFKTAELYGKLANIGDDIESEFIKNTGIFKKLVTGERLNAERKGQDPFDFNNYSKMIFSANNIPRLGGGKDTAAIARRLVIIPFDAKFSSDDSDFDPYIKDKLITQRAMEYLIKIAIEGLKRVLDNNKFTTSKRINKEVREYELSNDPLLGFIQHCEDEEMNIIHEVLDDVYLRYTIYCSDGNYGTLSRNEFSKQIQKHLNITTIQKRMADYGGKQKRIFIPIDTTETT